MLSLARLKKNRSKILEQYATEESEETGIFTEDTVDGVLVGGCVSLFTHPPTIKGSLDFGPSIETKSALEYIANLKECTLKELKLELLLMITPPVSKYKTQCLILIRNLYLIKSLHPLVEQDTPEELPSLPPLEWMGGLG